MNKELVKLINENPELDVVVMASTDSLTDEYGSILLESLRAEVADIYNSPCSETIYFCKEDVIDRLMDVLCDEEEYSSLPDDEYEKMCEIKANDYFYKKVIVIWAN